MVSGIGSLRGTCDGEFTNARKFPFLFPEGVRFGSLPVSRRGHEKGGLTGHMSEWAMAGFQLGEILLIVDLLRQ